MKSETQLEKSSREAVGGRRRLDSRSRFEYIGNIHTYIENLNGGGNHFYGPSDTRIPRNSDPSESTTTIRPIPITPPLPLSQEYYSRSKKEKLEVEITPSTQPTYDDSIDSRE